MKFAFALVLVCTAAPAQRREPPYARGMKLIEERDFAGAARELELAVKADPASAATHHALGLARLALNDTGPAAAELREAIRLKPDLAEAHLALGLALGRSGELAQAAEEFRKAIRLKPDYAEAHKRLGITLRRQGDAKGALEEFQAAVAANAKDPEAWYQLGLAHKSEGRAKEAVEVFQKAIALKPDFDQAHYNLGIALRAQGKDEASKKELRDVQSLRNFQATLAQAKLEILGGVEALQKDHPEQARERFERAATLSPTLPTAWHYLGVAWDRQGDEAKAMEAWRKALELQPDYPKTHSSLGVFLARRGDFARAVTEFRKAVAADPDDADGHYNLGLALEQLGKTEDAGSEFAEAVNLNPENNDARVRLALLLANSGNPAAAANVYREILKRQPAFAEVHNNLGLALLEDNDFAGAESAFREALRLKPDYAAALQNVKLTKPCVASQPPASLTIPHAMGAPELSLDPEAGMWKRAATAEIVKDCTHTLDYPQVASKVRAFWTDSDLYVLFICPYRKLNLFLPPNNDGPRNKLWDRDVVEMFLGYDWERITHYREFEIAPTGDWIDLAIDLEKKSYDRNWRSGWKTAARIDEQARVWYAAARIPLSSVSPETVKAGTRWRINLYRIEGLGPDSKRHFLCWQPTCVLNRDPNHVPENFGTMTFGE